MKKNYLFDVDVLLQVLQAIKDGNPVEYRPLEEPNWRDFNPEEYDIDTENCKYRVKPCEYSEYVEDINVPPALMQEGVIYFLKSKDPRSTKQSFACVKAFKLYLYGIEIRKCENEHNLDVCSNCTFMELKYNPRV